MRLFLAIPVPIDLSTATEPLKGSQFRPVPEGSWHMTARFMGESDPDEVQAAMEGFKASKLQARMTQAGAFPNPRHASVAWLGLSAGPELAALAADMEQRTKDIGEPERKGFVPHVTLGRLKRPMDIRAPLRQVQPPVGEFTLDRIDLMASELSPDGPQYHLVASWDLD